MRPSPVLAISVLAAALACAHSSTKPAAPAPAPTPAAPASGAARGGAVQSGTGTAVGTGVGVGAGAAAGRGAAGAGAPAGAGGRGTPLTLEQRNARRDSIDKLRGATVAQVMASIAGKEDQPAGQVFKNVQVLKDMPAKAFLTYMDSIVGRALNRNCDGCHVVTDFGEDTRNGNPIAGKTRTRIMMQMVNAINAEHLTKLPAGRGGSPTVNCITCHRGVGGNPGRAIIP